MIWQLISKSQEAINEGGLLPRLHMEHVCFTFKSSVPQFPSPGPKPFKRHMALRSFISPPKLQVGLSLGICVLLRTDFLRLPTCSHRKSNFTNRCALHCLSAFWYGHQKKPKVCLKDRNTNLQPIVRLSLCTERTYIFCSPWEVL